MTRLSLAPLRAEDRATVPGCGDIEMDSISSCEIATVCDESENGHNDIRRIHGDGDGRPTTHWVASDWGNPAFVICCRCSHT
ncbi:hypothetical protein Y032_0892g2898 [Ancylostoma ceylanicum]|uniref:Uncharacterized protein n=1 Tax=Ancylostoma ceylanicum TaxID=53326 RepID=A0A016WA40_9BILA|nr:hypothetical protein Y032_0892g2898 [Ancylostoma ceylanicum]